MNAISPLHLAWESLPFSFMKMKLDAEVISLTLVEIETDDEISRGPPLGINVTVYYGVPQSTECYTSQCIFSDEDDYERYRNLFKGMEGRSSTTAIRELASTRVGAELLLRDLLSSKFEYDLELFSSESDPDRVVGLNLFRMGKPYGEGERASWAR